MADWNRPGSVAASLWATRRIQDLENVKYALRDALIENEHRPYFERFQRVEDGLLKAVVEIDEAIKGLEIMKGQQVPEDGKVLQ